jgi:hypothetical protein
MTENHQEPADHRPVAVVEQTPVRRRYYLLLGAAGGSLATFIACLLVVAVA